MLKFRSDILLVLLTALQVSAIIFPFFVELSVPAIVGFGILNIFLMGTNYQCIAHNFIHNPFFRAPWANSIFCIINSIGLFVPQSMYRIHHLNHHRYNNRPEDDESSTWRYGKTGKEENIFLYALKGTFRTELSPLFNQARKQSLVIYFEILTLLGFIIFFAIVDWKLVLIYYLPTMLGGHIFAQWENYCEHHYANPQDRKRDSVSCYNRFYNFIWFNNGYHQEHHFSPQVHWTKISEVSKELPSDRVTVRGCHLTNSF